MQEHHQQQEPEQQTYSPSPVSGPILNPPADTGATDALLDAYLDSICANLPPEVDSDAAQDMRREMRGHLQAAVVAGQELGYAPEQSVEHAFAQFGKPQVVARQWQEEWETTLTATKAVPFLPSLKLASKMWAVSGGMAVAAGAILMMLILTQPESPLRLPLMFSIFFGPPLVSGTIIGMRARRHPVLATLAGYALLLPFLIVGFIGVNACQAPYVSWLTGKTFTYPFGLSVEAGIRSALSFMPLWIILSAFSSGMVTLARRYKTRARRQIAR